MAWEDSAREFVVENASGAEMLWFRTIEKIAKARPIDGQLDAADEYHRHDSISKVECLRWVLKNWKLLSITNVPKTKKEIEHEQWRHEIDTFLDARESKTPEPVW